MPQHAIGRLRFGLAEGPLEQRDDVRRPTERPSAARASCPSLQVAQDRAGGQRALAEGGSNAGVGIGDDVARGEDAGRGRAQLVVDDDRARPVEVELAGHSS